MEPSYPRSVHIFRRNELRMSDGALAKALSAGHLRRLLHGIYARDDCPLTPAERLRVAGLMIASPGSYLTCVSALEHMGLALSAGPCGAHVGVRASRSAPRRQHGLTIHQHDDAVYARDFQELSCTPRPLAVVRAFGCLPHPVGRQLVLSATQARFVLPGDIRARVRPRDRGRPALLELLDVIEAGCHSELEIRLLRDVVRRFGLPLPKLQYEVRLPSGVRRFDAAYVEQKVGLEADSVEWHFSAQARQADLRRDIELAAEGWLTLRITNERMRDEPEWVARHIAAALASRAP
jgi:very-short-patch-repair endonuclease